MTSAPPASQAAGRSATRKKTPKYSSYEDYLRKAFDPNWKPLTEEFPGLKKGSPEKPVALVSPSPKKAVIRYTLALEDAATLPASASRNVKQVTRAPAAKILTKASPIEVKSRKPVVVNGSSGRAESRTVTTSTSTRSTSMLPLKQSPTILVSPMTRETVETKTSTPTPVTEAALSLPSSQLAAATNVVSVDSIPSVTATLPSNTSIPTTPVTPSHGPSSNAVKQPTPIRNGSVIKQGNGTYMANTLTQPPMNGIKTSVSISKVMQYTTSSTTLSRNGSTKTGVPPEPVPTTLLRQATKSVPSTKKETQTNTTPTPVTIVLTTTTLTPTASEGMTIVAPTLVKPTATLATTLPLESVTFTAPSPNVPTTPEPIESTKAVEASTMHVSTSNTIPIVEAQPTSSQAQQASSVVPESETTISDSSESVSDSPSPSPLLHPKSTMERRVSVTNPLVPPIRLPKTLPASPNVLSTPSTPFLATTPSNLDNPLLTSSLNLLLSPSASGLISPRGQYDADKVQQVKARIAQRIKEKQAAAASGIPLSPLTLSQTIGESSPGTTTRQDLTASSPVPMRQAWGEIPYMSSPLPPSPQVDDLTLVPSPVVIPAVVNIPVIPVLVATTPPPTSPAPSPSPAPSTTPSSVIETAPRPVSPPTMSVKAPPSISVNSDTPGGPPGPPPPPPPPVLKPSNPLRISQTSTPSLSVTPTSTPRADPTEELKKRIADRQKREELGLLVSPSLHARPSDSLAPPVGRPRSLSNSDLTRPSSAPSSPPGTSMDELRARIQQRQQSRTSGTLDSLLSPRPPPYTANQSALAELRAKLKPAAVV